jgi:hypothetical protein
VADIRIGRAFGWENNAQIIQVSDAQTGVALDYDVGAQVTGEQSIALTSGSLPGCSFDPQTKRITGTPTTPGSYDLSFTADDGQNTVVADWQSRIGGPGVVWYHGFESDNEVNNFRWTPTIGNNPQGVTTPSYTGLVRRITTDGSDKGSGVSCLEVVRLSGSSDGSDWWRPMSPLVGGTTSGNGRGVGQNDPGAGGTIIPRAFSPTQGGSQTAGFSPGRYGNSIYHGEGGFDGTEYYLQMRVKIDPLRWQGINANAVYGKLIYLTRTDRSLTDQEINTETARIIGGNSYFSMYRSGSPGLPQDPPGVSVHGNQPGTQFGTVGDGVCRFDNNGGRLANCWFWPSGQWTTVLYHVRPGTSTGPLGSSSGNNDTLVEVWVAVQGATSYTKIWEQAGVDLPFDNFHGHNAVIASIYEGGEPGTGWYHRYDQIIFSKQFIPCPQVW